MQFVYVTLVPPLNLRYIVNDTHLELPLFSFLPLCNNVCNNVKLEKRNFYYKIFNISAINSFFLFKLLFYIILFCYFYTTLKHLRAVLFKFRFYTKTFQAQTYC